MLLKRSLSCTIFNSTMDHESAFTVHNLAFVEELQEAYRRDPSSVDPQWLPYFDSNDATAPPSARPPLAKTLASSAGGEQAALQSRVNHLIGAYRLHGHLIAEIDPLKRPRDTERALFELSRYDLDDSHLDREFHSAGLLAGKASLRAILKRLRRTYCRHIGVEYWHISNEEQRAWLRQRMESCENEQVPEREEQIRLLRSLTHVEAVDAYLHSKFLGAKRFSISGAESVISLLEWLVEEAGDSGLDEIVFAMAHRGRLNVLMNILGKSPYEVFSEFKSLDAESYLGGGDVKYHLGYHRYHTTHNGKKLYLALAFNPSHLEAITPVLQGRIRAKQDMEPDGSYGGSMGVTLHGDAAFAGQGVVSETLNMSQLKGYEVGGMIRVVINNQIGFTTNPRDSRSTIYCTDIAHGIGVPIFHVNGDDPEAAAYVARVALEWRQRFHCDAIIDLNCYRRFGHNEGDDPSYTQPQMYETIKGHASVRSIYFERLRERGTIDDARDEAMKRDLIAQFDDALKEAERGAPRQAYAPMHGIWERYKGGLESGADDPETGVVATKLHELGERMVAIPESFQVHRKMKRLLGERQKMWAGEDPLNWAAAELAAFGSLLNEGIFVRFTGQDVCRGTFSHRHATLTDPRTSEVHSPLRALATGNAKFEVYNSPLSEFSVLGFEFGYTLAAPESLIIWEAQFGDFANGAQVIIDQFLSSSEDKWNRISGLVMLLPHGYEGQGPEHSSARLERFLQLCAEDNMQVCYPTTPAQYFHLLRRQALRRWRKPLVVMTPKFLLRYRPCFSPIEELASGRFQRVLADPVAPKPEEVTRVLLCSGKIYYELLDERARLKRSDVALLRLEQLHPFPSDDLSEQLAGYTKVTDIRWVQEEPMNMGPWSYMQPRINKLIDPEVKFVGREPSASPATGSPDAHQLEREMILAEAFSPFSCVR